MYLSQKTHEFGITQIYLNHKDVRVTVQIYAGVTNENRRELSRKPG